MKDRLSPAEITRREQKHEYRRLVSNEYAKTRGIAVGALSNTAKLRTWVRYQTIGLLVEAATILGLWYYFVVR